YVIKCEDGIYSRFGGTESVFVKSHNADAYVFRFLARRRSTGWPGLFRTALAFLCLLGWSALGAQVTEPEQPAEKPLQQRMQAQSDSLLQRIIVTDSLPKPVLFTEFIVPMSKDSRDAPVEYGSVDSNYFDNEKRQVHLFG